MATDVDAQAKLDEGVLLVQRGRATLYGGTLDGRVGLDQRLELKGAINSSEQFVAAITRGAIPGKVPVTIPLTITGTLSAPEVKPGGPLGGAKGLLPGGLLPKGIENPVDEARKGIGDLFKRPRK